MKSDNAQTVMHLSWEYPPRSVGGLAAAVHDLSVAQAEKGLDVHVVTCDFPGANDYDHYKNVHVHRFESYRIPSENFLEWTLQMNLYMRMKAADVINSLNKKIDVIHCHDWLAAPAAISLKHAFRKPLVSTIHATEHGRRKGIHDDLQRMIHNIEWWLCFESWKIIACSDYMQHEVSSVFGVPYEKIWVIPNGVQADKFDIDFDKQAVRNKFALPHEKIVLFVGRLVHEKGIQNLISAVPQIVDAYQDVKFVISGDGYMKSNLKQLAWDIGVDHKVHFAGYVDDFTLTALYNLADIAVTPSLYEPFGIVALESMASGSATVATDTGGLSEIIQHEFNGVKAYPGNSDSLAWAISKLLRDDGFRDWIIKNGLETVGTKYNWLNIAETTSDCYKTVLGEYKDHDWKPGF